MSQQQPQPLSLWAQLPFVLLVRHGLVLSRRWQGARHCPSPPIYFYEQPSCLFFSWGEGLHIAPGCCLRMAWGLLQAATFAGKHPFPFCSCPAAPHGGTAGVGEGPKPSRGPEQHPRLLSAQARAAEHTWGEACVPQGWAASWGGLRGLWVGVLSPVWHFQGCSTEQLAPMTGRLWSRHSQVLHVSGACAGGAWVCAGRRGCVGRRCRSRGVCTPRNEQPPGLRDHRAAGAGRERQWG